MYEPKIDPELRAAFDAKLKETLARLMDEDEMLRGCPFCGSHSHPIRKCDAPPPEFPGLIPWLDAQRGD